MGSVYCCYTKCGPFDSLFVWLRATHDCGCNTCMQSNSKISKRNTVTTKTSRPPTKIIRFLGIAPYCIIRSLRLHHTYCFSSVTSLNDLFSTQVNRVDIFSGFVLNFSNFKNCENGSKKVTK